MQKDLLALIQFINNDLGDYFQSRTKCAASVKMSPINKESDLDEYGLNLDAACFITWSIGECSPSLRIIDESDLWLDSGLV